MHFQYASDQSLLVSFGSEIAWETHQRVVKLLRLLEARPIAAIRNLHPAYCSLLITFDPCRIAHDALESELRSQAGDLEQTPLPQANVVEIPVCYGGEFGPDLNGVAVAHGMDPGEVATTHAAATYTVYFLGFVPGFAYLGGLPDRLVMPRLPSPRKRVPPGSVGIAGHQTGVYPFATPGGWRLIGRTPLQMFQTGGEQGGRMSRVAMGDQVRFQPISPAEYRRLEAGEA